jgi:threonine dehydratase
MMESSNPVKIERVLKHQAAIAFCGNTFRDRQEKVEAIQEEEGRTVIYPFDHNDAILGSATVGLEILEQFQDMRRVVTPVSGGGLISGIALAVKQSNPDIEIIGVQPRGSNATTRSFNEGTKITLEKSNTVADGLRVTEPGSITFPLIQQFVDEMVEVSEDSIKAATSRIIFQEKLLVEPSGAVPLAAVLEGKVKSDNTLLVLSGGNIDPEFLKLLSREYQTKISRRKPVPQLD